MDLKRQKITWPFFDYEPKVLLHCCCAACTGEIIELLIDSNIQPAVFFCNPNIMPEQEYELRKKDVMRFAKQKGVIVIDSDYSPQKWLSFVEVFKNEPEGGKRCEACFLSRLKETARCAHVNGFSIFTSTLGISRHKNFKLVTSCGQQAAKEYPGLKYWDYNWRKKGGSMRMPIIADKHKFYLQDYCGCIFSLNQRILKKRNNEC